ncbi:MAG: bifunctional (p)ppGpp synthetase/guanosine-3',5'-bis(diphosphate) 3'-pyrophosphohydrolase [Prolixibacteraceae bacterium]|nr:bifunctional (p)ppGpp synthetase/guanosine-3',5'-bis(diphosphate) 3'-pyrophosphohydrolase [Prolixibacteraceae bacterium]
MLDKEGTFSEFFEVCRNYLQEKDLVKIQDAVSLLVDVFGDRKKKSGEYVINHSISVARIVVEEIGLGVDTVIAAILHNIFYQDHSTLEIEARFGKPVTSILEGMAKINSMGTDTVELHSENYRNLMLALAGDVRVILLKIADRLDVMRKLDFNDIPFRTKVSVETSFLYAPLAHRLGLYYINSELLDLCLKYQHPEAYEAVATRLQETDRERANFVAEFVKPIQEKLNARGFSFDMKARTKSINSIWRKMQTQKVDFDEVMDLFAIRVILNSELASEKSDCWQVYSVVTEEYQSNPKRMRDWITIPKSNGYESLHATVLGPHGKWVEIQIRTRRMDEIAEKGLAAHWKYKGGSGTSEMEKWLANVREILENPELNMVDFIDDFKMNVYADDIFVFTPKGDLKKLAAGATLLDFAYEVHSGVGDRCVGGRVNGKNVTLRHKLQNGDQIEVDTANHQRPKMDWLDFVVTTKAKNRIRASLNEEVKRQAEIGKEIVLRKVKNWKIEFNDDSIRKLLKEYKLKLAQDLYYNVSTGKIDTLEIKEILVGKKEETAKQLITDILPKDKVQELDFSGGDDYLVIDNNIKNVIYKLAPCCNPIFGDDIFGFVTISEGIKIHRSSCPNAPQMMERYPYRVIKAKWQDTKKKSSFQATIRIYGTDEVGIVEQISHVLAKDIGVSMRSINIETNNGDFDGTLRVFVNGLDHLDFLMNKLRGINGVFSVSRAD